MGWELETESTGVSEIKVGPFVICRSDRTVRLADRHTALTDAEFGLLWQLALRAGQPVTRDLLYRELLNIDYNGQDRTIDLRVSRLRRKLSRFGSESDLIRSVRSEGYMLIGKAELPDG